MKICSPQLGISPTSSLGGEVYDYYTLKGFALSNFKVFVYLPRDRYYDNSLPNFYVKYSFIKHMFPPIIFSIICLPYLLKTYKKEKFDVLRIHSPRYLGLAGILFHLFHPDVPILTSAVNPQASKLLYLVEKMIYRISSKIIVQSDYMKKRLQKSFKIEPKKIAVTFGGQLEFKKNYRKIPSEAKKIRKDEKVLLFMGIMDKRKNAIFLVDVIDKVIKVNPKIKLVLIGDGEQKKLIQQKLKEKKLLSHCIFRNSAYGEEKCYWLSRMDIFVLPSLEEGFGIAVTEAMSFGKPVVVSNIEPFKEIIKNNIDGYTLPLKLSIWIEKLVVLIDNKELRSGIGKKAKNKVEKYFTWQRTYDLNAKIIKEITD